MRPENSTGSSELWEETWKRVDRFLPDLFAEIFPEALESPPPLQASLEKPEQAGVVAQVSAVPVVGEPRTKEAGAGGVDP